MSDSGEKNDRQPDEEKSLPTESFADVAGGPGGQVGKYKILSVLGEGGYGIVYLAEQQGLVKRRVALKIIKPGMDTKHVVARFEAERQALALLDHPNIAQVYDAGTTETGRPYFVMEYVKGVPITDHCDRHKSGVEDRLKLFIDICEAVQHAHQKGIIHRDIKPSNIMVSIEGNDFRFGSGLSPGAQKRAEKVICEITEFVLTGVPEKDKITPIESKQN